MRKTYAHGLNAVSLDHMEMAAIQRALRLYAQQGGGALTFDQANKLADLIGGADAVRITPGYTQEI